MIRTGLPLLEALNILSDSNENKTLKIVFKEASLGISKGSTFVSILERYPECDLNPRSERYVARVIGDKKVRYDFDQEDPSERRLVITGKYPNLSSRIRIQMNLKKKALLKILLKKV